MDTTGERKQIFLDFNDGQPKFERDDPITLNYGDQLGISLRGFPWRSWTTKVQFYHSKPDPQTGKDVKDHSKPAGSWVSADNKKDGLYAYDCWLNQSNGGVYLRDVEHPQDNDKYFFEMHIIGQGGPWDVDPELINKGKGGG